MFGAFVLGGLFTMGVIGVARRRRYYRRHGWGGHGHHGHHRHGCHGGGHGCHGGHGPHGHGGPGRRDFEDDGEWGGGYGSGFLRSLFARLETTPTQEREIRSAMDDVRRTARGAKGRLKDLGEELGRAMRLEELDADTLGTLLANQDSALDDVKKELVGALARIHDVLDQDQRERLARFLERMGPRGMRWA